MVQGKSRKLNRGGPCVTCGATQSTLFRRSPEGIMCNPCGLRKKRQLQKQQREVTENVHEGFSHEEQVSNDRSASEDTEQILVDNRTCNDHFLNDDRVEVGNEGRNELPKEEHKVCSFCFTDISAVWRVINGKHACNKCALRARRKGKRQSDLLTESLADEHLEPAGRNKRRATSDQWHQGVSGEPAPPAIDQYVRELATCGHVSADDMRMYLCLWTELSTEQRRLASEAVSSARAEGDTRAAADHVRLVVSHNEEQYGRKALIHMVNELMGPFEGCANATAGELLVA